MSPARTREKPQWRRVWDALVAAGDKGIVQADFHLDGGVIDGGKPIDRLAPRIHELKKKHGVVIDTQRVQLSDGGDPVARYFYVGDMSRDPNQLRGQIEAPLEFPDAQMGLEL